MGESGSGSQTGFPTETLATPVKDFVEQSAASLPVAADIIALPCLVALGTAIGNTRVIRAKDGWQESAALYAAIIADTGSMKSAALGKATEPLKAAQTATKRTWVADTTVEKLGQLLSENKRGLTIVLDELMGWVKSLNQYRNGKGGDREFYLSAWSGSDLAVDRKNLEAPIIVHKPFLSVAGCLPPDRLHELEGGVGEDGFIQRFLFAWPSPVPAGWTDLTISAEVRNGYEGLIKQLLHLPWQGVSVPMPLTAGAQELLRDWINALARELASPNLDPSVRGYYAKLKGYCARLALIHAVSTDPDAEEVGVESVRAALKQTEYFKQQATIVAKWICRSVGATKEERCKQEIRRKLSDGKVLDKRLLQHNSQFKADLFNEAFRSMMQPELIEVTGGVKLRTETAFRGTDIPTTDKAA